MTDLPAQQVLLEALAVVHKLGIAHAVMGGFAVRAWGVPRPTYDGDIAVVADDAQLATLLSALDEAGFDVPHEHSGGFLDRVGPFPKAKVNRFLSGFVWTTDLFIVQGPFLESAIKRARPAYLGEHLVQVISPEDIIILKLLANRRKDLSDIDDLLVVCVDVDWDYLQHWAHRFGIEDRLRAFR